MLRSSAFSADSLCASSSVRQVVSFWHDLLSVGCIQLQLIQTGVVNAMLLGAQLCMSADTASDAAIKTTVSQA